jgi:hypothetical protein
MNHISKLALAAALGLVLIGPAHAEQSEQLCVPLTNLATVRPGQTIALACETDGLVQAYPIWHAGSPPFAIGWEATPEAAAREGEPSGFVAH